ncbi:MAG: IPTL-CTERM sorting domain-containing protein [Delftia acidovorans]|jgi:hypothetical protein|nr:IPTL-CTERM sorting domain-containing protein [Delftia acidovorans]
MLSFTSLSCGLRHIAVRWLLAASAALPAAAALAVTPYTTIAGSPLQIRVGEDNSFQVTSSAAPGRGLIQPLATPDSTADMGFVVAWPGALFKPDFDSHAGTHITGIGLSGTPFVPRSLSPVSGSGSASDPFIVTVTSALGTSGVTATLQVRYVNGDAFFTKSLTLRNDPVTGTTRAAKVLLGATFAAPEGRDGNTLPHYEVASTSVGGRGAAVGAAGNACPAAGDASETLLLVPKTTPDAYFAGFFNAVWRQIDRAQLENRVDAACRENGGALQWNRSLAPGDSVTVQSVLTYGEIPVFARFDLSAITPNRLAAGTTTDVTVEGLGFGADTSLDFGAGITVRRLDIVDGRHAVATLLLDPTALPGARTVRATQTPGGLAASLTAGVSVAAAPDHYMLGGTVSGLRGNGLVLSLDGAVQTLAVDADGGFVFPATLRRASSYSVTVSAQPVSPAQTCSVTRGSGTVDMADVTDVVVTCVAAAVSHTVTPGAGAGGTISPQTAQSVADNATVSFSVRPDPGRSAQVGGSCGGTLSGNTYTTRPVTADCTVVASFTFAQAPTALTLSAAPNPVVAGRPLVLTATVVPADAGGRMGQPSLMAPAAAAVPGGSVTFSDNGVFLGSAALNADGSASLSTSTLQAGTHALSASYSGDVANAPSATLSPLTVVVQAAGSPAPVAVPALSPWGMACLGLALAALGLVRRRRM